MALLGFGLDGPAHQGAHGIPRGQFTVLTAQMPPTTHVDPVTGQVVAGPAPNAKGVAARNFQRAVR